MQLRGATRRRQGLAGHTASSGTAPHGSRWTLWFDAMRFSCPADRFQRQFRDCFCWCRALVFTFDDAGYADRCHR